MNGSDSEKSFFSPDICGIPTGSSKRLIDSGMLHYEASVAGYNERYHKGETSHTIHVWWARRPHSAMRALVFASLAKDSSDASSDIMAALAVKPDNEVIDEAKNIIYRGYGGPPKVLDMFGGGGTIPFEAVKLGADTYSIDANQLSVFIQSCNMLYADRVDLEKAKRLAESCGTDILKRLKKETDWLYPLRKKSNEKIFGYIWSYRTICPKCGKSFYLMKKPILSAKKGRKISFVLEHLDSGDKLSISEIQDNTAPRFVSAWKKGSGECFCPYCGAQQPQVNISDCEDTISAVIRLEKIGKSFACPSGDTVPSTEMMKEKEKELLSQLDAVLPQSELPVWSGVVNPALYGIRTHADFLNQRQRLLLLYLIRALSDKYTQLKSDDEVMAKFVAGVLSSLIDQVIDWNCRLSCWIQNNEQVGRAFCGPGIAMLWDYAETDMLLKGPANLWDKLKRIIKGISSFSGSGGKITIKHAHAQNLPFESNYFDAIVTDPPYYDNIYYSILADFFYAWKRILLKRVEPELFKSDITDRKYELVASSRREGRGKEPHESYCLELKQAFSEAARVIKNDGVFSFIYSHSSAAGWDAVIQAYRSSPFFITSVQPLSIERKGRPRAVTSEAVNTCIAFIARKSDEKKKPIGIHELRKRVSEISNEFGRQLIDTSGWSESDTGLEILACAAAMLANSERAENVDSDIDALIIIAQDIKKAYPGFNLKTRKMI